MHIFWDWNGTLLDDTEACCGALNLMLERRGKQPLTLKYFRDHFAFPARQFYVSIGMNVLDSEWEALAKEYYTTYLTLPAKLNDEALAALGRLRELGIKQSVLSALRQDELEASLEHYGIREYFEHVAGTDNLDGASKLERGKALFAEIDDRDVVMIGDALHDKEVADQLGARCVLCSQGGHSYERLAAVAPTGRTLLEAVNMAIGNMI